MTFLLRSSSTRIASNCPRLERLTVGRTTNSIEISHVNLVSFSYCGIATNLLLSKVPFLVEVSISEEPLKNSSDDRRWVWGMHYLVSHRSIVLPFTQLSCYLAQLEILEVDICNYDVLVFFPSCWITWFLTPCSAFRSTMTATHFLY